MSDIVFWLLFAIGSVIILFLSLFLRTKKMGYIFIPPVLLGIIASTTYIVGWRIIGIPVEETPVIMEYPLLLFSIAGASLVIVWIIFYRDVRKSYKI